MASNFGKSGLYLPNYRSICFPVPPLIPIQRLEDEYFSSTKNPIPPLIPIPRQEEEYFSSTKKPLPSLIPIPRQEEEFFSSNKYPMPALIPIPRQEEEYYSSAKNPIPALIPIRRQEEEFFSSTKKPMPALIPIPRQEEEYFSSTKKPMPPLIPIPRQELELPSSTRNFCVTTSQELHSIVHAIRKFSELLERTFTSEPLSNGLGVASVEDNDPSHVVLCAFQSTNCCAIRSKNSKVMSSLYAVLKKVHNYGVNAPVMKTIPIVGTFAIAELKEEFRRVEVLDIVNVNIIRLSFYDCGFIAYRKLSDMRVISDEILNLKRHIKVVNLYGVNRFGYNVKIREFMKCFLKKEFAIKYISGQATNAVELYDIENGELFNEIIMKFCTNITNQS